MHSTRLDASTLEKLVSAATAAPSLYNTQPWRFRLDPDTLTVEIRAAVERGLPYADPHGRALHVAVGAAAFNLRVAVAHLGWKPVTRLLTDPEHPDLLVTVRIAGRARPGVEHRADLYDAIWRRHSSRLPFCDRRPPVSALAEIAAAAHVEGVSLTLPGPHETDRLLRVTTEAERRNHAEAERGIESRRWVRTEAGGGDDGLGIPAATLGPQDSFEQIPMRDFTARRYLDDLPSRPFEHSPTITVLATRHDRRTDWLRAGQALQHALLVATAHGLRSSLLHQAMEWPDLRRYLRAADAPLDHVQMLMRLGYGPEGPATPRQRADLALEQDGAPLGPWPSLRRAAHIEGEK
ncbi:nitroreductase family protein [Streptomyces sp. NPDC041068]|uniref:Acg family FMN-binding oxidoreductase n=1 Tax=Streptomyces sp. NPDC041068 TaxID=3155130 RepID=UPI0033E1B12E